MKATGCILAVVIPFIGGCALMPPQQSSVRGTHTVSIDHHLGTSVRLNRDGTYERSVSFFSSAGLVIESTEGKEVGMWGWTNTETGTWTILDRAILLEPEDREIENPNVEESFFEAVRSYPITYKFPHGWMLIYPSWRNPVMKKKPNQPLQRNASTGPVSNFESPARRG